MNTAYRHQEERKTDRLMLLTSILMIAGSLFTTVLIIDKWIFFSKNPFFLVETDIIISILTGILIILEFVYSISVLMMKFRKMTCRYPKLKPLVILMQLLNFIIFALCLLFMRFFSEWIPQGYFRLSDFLLFLLPPGLIVKTITLITFPESS